MLYRVSVKEVGKDSVWARYYVTANDVLEAAKKAVKKANKEWEGVELRASSVEEVSDGTFIES